jgi:hypothetical protein
VPGGYEHEPLPSVADRAKLMLKPAIEPAAKTP